MLRKAGAWRTHLMRDPRSGQANGSLPGGTSRPEAEFRPDLLGRYRLRARLDLGQRLARRLSVREVLQQLAELLGSQARQFGRELGREGRGEPLAVLSDIDNGKVAASRSPCSVI
jgi:hypothetical protein